MLDHHHKITIMPQSIRSRSLQTDYTRLRHWHQERGQAVPVPGRPLVWPLALLTGSLPEIPAASPPFLAPSRSAVGHSPRRQFALWLCGGPRLALFASCSVSVAPLRSAPLAGRYSLGSGLRPRSPLARSLAPSAQPLHSRPCVPLVCFALPFWSLAALAPFGALGRAIESIVRCT